MLADANSMQRFHLEKCLPSDRIWISQAVMLECWTFFVSRRSPDCDWHFLFSHVIFCSCFFNGHSIASFSHLSIDGLRMFAILGCKKWTYAYTVLFGDILGTITPKKINKKTTKQNKRVEEVAVSTVGLVDLVLPKFTAEARWLWNSKVFGEMMQFFEEIMSHVLDLWGTLKPMGNFLWISMAKTLPRRSWLMR